MKFGHPQHRQHMMSGVKAALASPKTPRHLIPHLQKRLQGAPMPAVSKKQQALFAIAEHAPQKLYPQNQGLANLGKKTLHDFAATPRTGLPTQKRKKKPMSPFYGM